MINAASAQPVFRALADPTRREIISMLAVSARPISDITDAFDITRPAIAKHLRILEQGGLITVEVKGRERINRLNPQALKAASDWLNYFEAFWDERLAKLKEVVEDKK
ncbi:MAG: winged helix-turn-helix transcriptional regulator [Alphaproteobacteria bacterium]|nr:winged helix-turn-helix transcriptional regulator [Alphaproteobacteria bacterium]